VVGNDVFEKTLDRLRQNQFGREMVLWSFFENDPRFTVRASSHIAHDLPALSRRIPVRLSHRKLLLRQPGRVGPGGGAEKGCAGRRKDSSHLINAHVGGFSAHCAKTYFDSGYCGFIWAASTQPRLIQPASRMRLRHHWAGLLWTSRGILCFGRADQPGSLLPAKTAIAPSRTKENQVATCGIFCGEEDAEGVGLTGGST
jgi:hypothetical protein